MNDEYCPLCQSPVTIGGDGLTHWYASEFNTPSAQEIVATNVAARGYRDGWTAEQFVARQLAKLTEELSEALACMRDPGWNHYWTDDVFTAGRCAREDFDRKVLWDTVAINEVPLRSELADMLVVLFTAAQALDFDVVQAAIDKSAADVARGVR